MANAQEKRRFAGVSPDAAMGYDRAATNAHHRSHGADAVLNFPPGPKPNGVLIGTHVLPLLVPLGDYVVVEGLAPAFRCALAPQCFAPLMFSWSSPQLVEHQGPSCIQDPSAFHEV